MLHFLSFRTVLYVYYYITTIFVLEKEGKFELCEWRERDQTERAKNETIAIKLNTWRRKRRKRKKCKVYIYTILYFDIYRAIIMHGCTVPSRNLEILKCTNSNPVCLWCLFSNSGSLFTFHFPLTVFGYTDIEHCMHVCVWYQTIDSRDWRGYFNYSLGN